MHLIILFTVLMGQLLQSTTRAKHRKHNKRLLKNIIDVYLQAKCTGPCYAFIQAYFGYLSKLILLYVEAHEFVLTLPVIKGRCRTCWVLGHLFRSQRATRSFSFPGFHPNSLLTGKMKNTKLDQGEIIQIMPHL